MKFEIAEEDKEIILKTILKMNDIIHDELERDSNSIITKKKNKFNFNESVE